MTRHEEYLAEVDRRLERGVAKRDSGCWEWTGSVTGDGYARVSVYGRRIYAHRYVLMRAGILVPDGMDACHRCDNPRCVNPAHLFVGTRKDNMQDAVSKGRVLKGERQPNAKLADAQVQQIRIRAAAGDAQHSIAADYDVSQSAVSLIVNGKRRSE